MKLFDVAVVAVFIAATVAGWRKGLLRVVLPVAGAVLCLIASARFAPRLIVEHTSPADVAQRGWLVYGAFLLLPLVGASVGTLVANWLGAFAERGSGGGHPFGALAAVAACAAVVWILAPLSQRQQAFVSVSRGSFTARVLDDLPAPPVDVDSLIAKGVLPPALGKLLGSPPELPPPTALPTMPAAAIAAVRAGTVQVFAQSCGKEWSGSGFVLRPGVVVTNAHVVQGASDVEVVSADGQQVQADVIVYDADRDLAMLSAPGLRAGPLPLAAAPADIGDVLVSAGHPKGDRSLHVAAARVDGFGFIPLDIPPAGPANREVYTLASADIAPGSSGGPLVNPRGEVVGVVFAGGDKGTALAFAIDEVRHDLALPGAPGTQAGACANPD